MNAEDICVWADGTWCHGDEVEQMSHMSDDFEILTCGTPAYEAFVDKEEI